MNSNTAMAIIVVALFSSYVANNYINTQVKIEQAKAQAECYKVAQGNPKFTCDAK